jgi:hypothetical protein
VLRIVRLRDKFYPPNDLHRCQTSYSEIDVSDVVKTMLHSIAEIFADTLRS